MLGILIEILGVSFKILGICDNRIPYFSHRDANNSN